MDDLLLYQKLSSLPEDLKQRVAEFIDALTKKTTTQMKKGQPGLAAPKECLL